MADSHFNNFIIWKADFIVAVMIEMIISKAHGMVAGVDDNQRSRVFIHLRAAARYCMTLSLEPPLNEFRTFRR